MDKYVSNKIFDIGSCKLLFLLTQKPSDEKICSIYSLNSFPFVRSFVSLRKPVYFLVHVGFLRLRAVGAALSLLLHGGISLRQLLVHSRALGDSLWWLWHTAARRAFPHQDRAHVPCVGRWVIIHRKVLKDVLHLTPFSCEPTGACFLDDASRICFTMNTSVSSYGILRFQADTSVLVPIWI